MSSSPSPTARVGRLAVLAVGLCWLAVLFDGLDMFIYGSVLPHMLEQKAWASPRTRPETWAVTPPSGCWSAP